MPSSASSASGWVIKTRVLGHVSPRGPVVSAVYTKLFYDLICRSIGCKFEHFYSAKVYISSKYIMTKQV